MDGFLGLAGIIALIAGAMFFAAGLASGDVITTYQGSGLVGASIGMLATSEALKVLKEIRDALKPTSDDQTPR